MIIQRIDAAAAAFSGRYNAHLMSLEGLLRRYVNSPNMDSESVRLGVRFAITQMALLFVRVESVRFSEEILSVSRTAAGDEMDSSLEESLNVQVTRSVSSFASQVDRDASAIIKHFNDLSIRSVMFSRQKGWSRSASITATKKEFDKEVRYTFLDRSGKSWESLKYIKTLVRGRLLETHNESLLYAIAMSGKNKAFVKNTDEFHKSNNVRISITPSDKYDTYESVKSKLFHPNSNSFISEKR